MNITLAPGLYEEIVAHARQCHPLESCGIVAGHGMSGERYIQMKNALASSTAFEMDPAELVAALRTLRESGEEMIAIVHSHPKGPATPSARDVRQAFYARAAHVIVSLETPDRPEVRGFRIIGGEVLEIELHVIV